MDEAAPRQADRAEAEALAARVMSAAADVCRQEAVWLRLLGEFDVAGAVRHFDGIVSVAHWLSWACSLAPGTAREHVRVARALRRMPHTMAAFSAAQISYSKVRELTRLVDEHDEDSLLQLARHSTASQLSRTVAAYRGLPGNHEEQEARSRVRWTNRDDGSVHISAVLTPEQGAVVVAALEAATDSHLDPGDVQDRHPSARASGSGTDHVAGAGDATQTGHQQSETGHEQSETGQHRPSGGQTGAVRLIGPERSETFADRSRRARVNAVVEIANHYLNTHPDDRSGEDRTTVVVDVSVAQLIRCLQTHPQQRAGAPLPVTHAAVGHAVNPHAVNPRVAEPVVAESVVAGPVVAKAPLTEPVASTEPADSVGVVEPPEPNILTDPPQLTDSPQLTGERDLTEAPHPTSHERLNGSSATGQADGLPCCDVPAGTRPVQHQSFVDHQRVAGHQPFVEHQPSIEHQPSGEHRPYADHPIDPDDPVRSNETGRRTHLADVAEPREVADSTPVFREGVCRVRGHGSIEPATAERLVCEATLIGVITAPDHDHAVEPLAVGRTKRLGTPAQRRALMVRDQHCQFPGCPRTRHLKIHHVISWLDGGATDLDNLMLLCQHHHTSVHEGRITVSRLKRPVPGRTGTARWHFVRPDGSTVVPEIVGFGFPAALPSWRDADGVPRSGAARPLPQAGRDAAHDQQRDDLAEARAELAEQYAQVASSGDRQARSLFPVGGGEGFRLHNCVDVLFAARQRVVHRLAQQEPTAA